MGGSYDDATSWGDINPLTLFGWRPADFRDDPPSICAGIYWLPGMASLLALPAAGTWGCWRLWPDAGAWALLLLAPAVVVWAWLAAADVAFRRRSPTPAQRARFDDAAVNWFGLAASLTLWPASLLAGAAAAAWRLAA